MTWLQGVLILLTGFGCGAACVLLMGLDRQLKHERSERHQLWIAERATRLSIDMARGTALDHDEVKAALLRAMGGLQ